MCNIKIAIHHREGSFSERWIAYCEENKISFLVVDCFDSTIIQKLKEGQITHLMWHFNHASSKDLQVFPYVFNAAENLNIKTFPNFQTRWHFDDKIAQKYLLESINAPYVESHVFYEMTKAKEFIEKTPLPIVAKLKRGAGATNVELLKTKEEANSYINEMFTIGRNPLAGTFENFDQKLRVAKKIKDPILLTKKVLSHMFKNKKEKKLTNQEKGYVYFQKFVPNNLFDTRIIIIGDIAFGVRRFNRQNDFRASGSGLSDYSSVKIDHRMIKIAFEISKKIGAQSLAFDFVFDHDSPKILEICFGFNMNFYNNCEGYWNSELTFFKGDFNPQQFMIEDFLKR